MSRRIVVFLGAPGSGKGTQATMAAARLGLCHMSTGHLLRSAITEGTKLGLHVQSILEAGALVSDDVMHEVVRDKIAKPNCLHGVILDGFPRTIRQAHDLDSILDETGGHLGVILIDVSKEVRSRRLEGRRSCPTCGKVFNVYESPSSRGAICDACGTEILQRQDDRAEIVNQRFEVYSQQTEPLVLYYKKLGLLNRINGEQDVEQVHKDIFEVLKSL